MVTTGNPRARVIAFYLPQFHPIPENDEWWGKGFTEWTNVVRAKPLYPGHEQPKLPGELGFYDLRVPEVREAQAELAREHGVEGFMYWHYWFAGKRLLERPFNEVLKSGKPDFPFCLGWANESWGMGWHGDPHRILIEQTYPGREDYIAHFREILPALTDPRYVKVDGCPLILIYRPHLVPNSWEFTDTWRKCAEQAGLPGLHLVGQHEPGWVPAEHGYDALVEWNVRRHPAPPLSYPPSYWLRKRLAGKRGFGRLLRWLDAVPGDYTPPSRYLYEPLARDPYGDRHLPEYEYPRVICNWDNTPRLGSRGYVLEGSTPDLFALYLRNAIAQVEDRPVERRLVFLKSWNEWAEGNYVEPDAKHGRAWLRALRSAVLG